MNVIFKILLFVLINFSLNAQYEDIDDLEFEEVKIKKIRTEKRKFNVHLEVGYSLATIFGSHVVDLKDTLSVIQKRYNLNSFRLTPVYYPYGKINATYNFNDKISLLLGLKYNRLGWKELAKFDNSLTKYRYYNRYILDYVSIPISLSLHINKNISFSLGNSFSILLDSQYNSYEYQKTNGNVRIDRKTKQTFEAITGQKPLPLISQLFFGSEIGSDRIKFSSNLLFTGNFIHSKLNYRSFSIEAGILFKLLNDYE